MHQFSFFFRIFANRNREPFRFDRDTHQIKPENRVVFSCQWRATPTASAASRKAGGLQRRRALKSFNKGVFITSSGGYPFLITS